MSVVLYCSFFPLLTFIFLLFPSQSFTDKSNDVSRKVSNSHLWFLKRNSGVLSTFNSELWLAEGQNF